jgi:hypothetical protein
MTSIARIFTAKERVSKPVPENSRNSGIYFIPGQRF